MNQVFISYRRNPPDEQIAERLYAYLQARGLRVFIDKKIKPSQDWTEEIEQELQASKIFIVLLSKRSVKSDMVRSEIQTAYEFRQTIFPIRLDFRGKLSLDLKSYLGRRQYLDLGSEDSEEKVFSLLYEAVAVALSPVPTQQETTSSSSVPPSIFDQPVSAAIPQVTMDTGTIRASSLLYARRREDDLAERFLSEAGNTIIVWGPRQSGKSSLLARIHARARNQGRRSVFIDFQDFDDDQLASIGRALKTLAGRIAQALSTLIQPSDVWDSVYKGEKASFAEFLERAALATQHSPLVLILDEVDRRFNRSFAEEFFTTVKGWEHRQATEENWDNIHIFIGYANNPAIWTDNLGNSPPGIGRHLRLDDFDYEQVAYLNSQHGAPLRGTEEVNKLMALVGGHPFLIRRSLYLLSAEKWSLERLQSEAPRERGPFEVHLQEHLQALHQNNAMRLAVLDIANGSGCNEEGLFQRLLSVGLVRGETRIEARLRCDLYQQYFPRHL